MCQTRSLNDRGLLLLISGSGMENLSQGPREVNKVPDAIMSRPTGRDLLLPVCCLAQAFLYLGSCVSTAALSCSFTLPFVSHCVHYSLFYRALLGK